MMFDNQTDIERMQFVTERDGPEEAMYFARQCVHQYKIAALASKRKNGQRGTYRRAFIESYLFHKQYILENS